MKKYLVCWYVTENDEPVMMPPVTCADEAEVGEAVARALSHESEEDGVTADWAVFEFVNQGLGDKYARYVSRAVTFLPDGRTVRSIG